MTLTKYARLAFLCCGLVPSKAFMGGLKPQLSTRNVEFHPKPQLPTRRISASVGLRAMAGFEELALRSGTGVVSAVMQKFLSISTPMASQILFLSPLAAMKKFRKEGTKEASAIPYAAMVANGAAWCAYGALAPTPDLTIMLANVGGIIFGAYYCVTFWKYMGSASDGPQVIAGSLAMVAAIVAAAGLLPAKVAHELIGFAGVALGVLMFSGPLASVQVILRDCSASSLPIGFTLATVANCLLWVAYGALSIHDPLVWGPNVAGLVASAMQLGLYLKYGENEGGCEVYYGDI